MWFGWFGFNAGSAVASTCGALGWLIAETAHRGRPSALGAASGIVAGLVGITPAAGFVAPWAAIIIGGLAGVFCYLAVVVKGRAGYDDSLDVFGVHGVGGTWGALATGVFASIGATGLLYGNAGQLFTQFIGVVAAGAYAVIVTFILVKILDATMGFRVDEEEEEIGLDQSEHGETGYTL